MKTKLILTLSKDLEDKVFTDLWKSKYSSLGTMEITSDKLVKTLVIENAPISTIEATQGESLENIENYTQKGKALSINDFTSELVKTNRGIIKTIKTETLEEEEKKSES